MMWTAQPDIYLNSAILGGLPTCVFLAAPYKRRVTSMLVTNTVPSTVNVYRGALGSVPVASNQLGQNVTLRGPLIIPPGQPWFVQWTAVGNATARASLERDDNPLGEASEASSVSWDAEVTNSLTAGNTSGQVLIGADIPQELRNVIHAKAGATIEVYACALWAAQAIDFTGNANYLRYEALVRNTVPPDSTRLRMAYGFLSNGGDTLSDYHSYDPIIGGSTFSYGIDVADSRITLGSLANAGIDIKKAPFATPAELHLAAGVSKIDMLSTIALSVNSNQRLFVDTNDTTLSAFAGIVNLTGQQIQANGLPVEVLVGFATREATAGFAAETVMTTTDVVVVTGKVYFVEGYDHYESTAVNEVIIHRIRVTGPGAVQQQTLPHTTAASNTYANMIGSYFIAGSSGTVTVSTTLERATALGACQSVGSATQYRNYVKITEYGG